MDLNRGQVWNTKEQQRYAFSSLRLSNTGSFLDWKYLPELNQIHYKESKSTPVHDFKRASWMVLIPVGPGFEDLLN